MFQPDFVLEAEVANAVDDQLRSSFDILIYCKLMSRKSDWLSATRRWSVADAEDMIKEGY